MLLLFFLNLQWIWAILFLGWVIPDLKTGVTYFVEPVERAKNPIVYWMIVFVWIVSSTYLLVDEFAPTVLPEGWSTIDYSTYQAQQKGEYILDYAQHEQEPDTLLFKNYVSPQFNIVGVSALTTRQNNESDFTQKELWDYFLKEDISVAIPDIIDDKVYVVYSDYDKGKKGQFQITIGYKTASLDNIYEGLTGVKVKASKYAAFELGKDIEQNLKLTWEKIEFSDLERSKTNDLEIYHYNPKTEAFYKADILIAVPTSKTDLANLTDQSSSTTKDNPTVITPRIVLKEKAEPYKPKTKIIDNPITPMVEKEQEYPTQAHKAFYVVGIEATANFGDNKDMEEKIEQLWDDFFEKDYAKHIYDIEDYEKVYVTYSNYSSTTVKITIGYKTKTNSSFKAKKGLATATVDANDYYNFQLSGQKSDFEGEEWQILNEALEYRDEKSDDFEVYTFDKNYEVIDAYMWVGAK